MCLALYAKVHDMVAANGAVVDDDICERKQNGNTDIFFHQVIDENNNGMSFTWRIVAGYSALALARHRDRR